MKAKLLLRIAVACITIHLLGHLVGHFTWKNSEGNVEREQVVKSMTEHKFYFMGATRSFGDYYEGYSALLLIEYLVFILVFVGCIGICRTSTSDSEKIDCASFSRTSCVWYLRIRLFLSICCQHEYAGWRYSFSFDDKT